MRKTQTCTVFVGPKTWRELQKYEIPVGVVVCDDPGGHPGWKMIQWEETQAEIDQHTRDMCDKLNRLSKAIQKEQNKC